MKSVFLSEKGVTLLELMIAIAIAGILSAAVFTVYEAQVRTHIAQEVTLELQQDIRSALLFMTREIRTAGSDPLDDAGAGIEVANADEFHFTRDIVGDIDTGQYDGKLDDDIENVRYFINADNMLQREIGDAGDSVTLLNNVDALNFVYLETIEPGVNSLNDGLANVAADNFDRIRYVQLTIVAHSGQSDRGLLRRYRDTGSYENQWEEEIYKADDTSRRMRMTTTIALRNM